MTNLITAEGLMKLREEYEHLWKVVRPQIAKAVGEAADEGDRSENAEYIYGKKKLGEIDRKLRHLGSRLKVLKVAAPPDHPQKVSFGCWVTYEEDETGEERCYQLVGPEEIDVTAGRISIDSPVGRALLGKKVDDDAVFIRPAGKVSVCITGIFAARPKAGRHD